MNKLLLIGNMTRDAEVKAYGKGKNAGTLCKVDIAVNRKYKNEDGEYDTDFFRCTAFGKTAEFIEEHTEKGCKIALDCELRNNNYEDEDGNMVYNDQILINNVEIMKHSDNVDKKGKRR